VGGEFDFSAMNNRAARQARGEYLLLLNNDTECIHNDWLDVMMSHAQRPDVGIVGARLLFPKTLRIQHAGMVLGIDQRAEHVFTHLTYDAPGYMNRALVDQEYSAVTGACLLIRTAIFHAVAGLDATLKTLCQDVDLCLKVKELGYRVIWTPSATLLHHASATLGRKPDAQKSAIIQLEYKESLARWKHRFTNDPAWNRNLSLGLRNVIPSLEKELVIPWNPDFHDRPRILAMPATGHGTVEYRLAGPLRALNAQGRLHYAVVCQPRHDEAQFAPHSVELDRLAPDVLLLDTPVDDIRCLALLSCKEWNPEIFRVCLLDDLITMVPESNPMYAKLPSDKITDRLRFVLNTCHRLIVSTAPLAEAYRGMIDDIRIVPNALEWKIWGGLQSQRRRGKKLRVGWAGAQQHAGDLRLVLDVVKATHKEVDWIFLGMLPEGAKPYVTEFHDYVHHLADYPAKLASLDLDLAIAPLETHPFNEAKSNLRLLEYGILGWPVICTDIFPYQTGNPPVTRLPNNADQWITAIRERIGEADSLAREGDALREWVKRHYLLKNRLDQWLSAVTKA
ncbi:MAG: glycosyltransferase, partial [Candidatus Accumulibacter sp.]|nr:glycosyltransferase [Accumulibacter sp.]